MHKVSIGELQKINHIEDDRKLQIGQTLVIPGAGGATVTPSPTASAPNE
jgi:LysM repeat protein